VLVTWCRLHPWQRLTIARADGLNYAACNTLLNKNDLSWHTAGKRIASDDLTSQVQLPVKATNVTEVHSVY